MNALQPSKDPLRVSDHAVLRYLERHHGFDMDLIRQHIFAICSAPAAFGAVAVRAEGVKFVITDGVVVTVAPDTQAPTRLTRARAQEKMARAG